MSMFYCEQHGYVEDSDFVGYRVVGDKEYCDEGGMEVLIQWLQEEENSLTNEEVCPSF